jgi:hypothetical protein
MSNAIQFLEAIGHHPALIHGASRAYAEAVAVLDVDDAQRAALLERDHAALNALLNGRSRMLCAICAPDDNEQEAIPDEGDVDGDGVPDDEPSPAKD